MGAHWEWLGYGSVDALVAEARSGVHGQVRLMARYIEKANLVKALQEQDWVAFARTYNGPAYKKNRYDVKMQNAFLKFTEEKSSTLPTPIKDDETSPSTGRLMFGAKGKLVRHLQRTLTRLGYVLVADGFFGLVTDRVVRQFQRDHLLAESGIVGAKEAALIFGKKQVRKLGLESIIQQRSPQQDQGHPSEFVKRTFLNRISRGLRKGLLSISNRFA